jgi:DNA repair exonuclease SbcCD ATPase subunit
LLIHKITVENFMALGTAELELPEAGVTVITGHNGAGKSRLIEAVAYAYWGETLRGEDPWLEGQAGSVTVLSDVGDASRKITAKGTKTLFWNGQKADTNSRTQEQIRAVVPEFDVWRRTHVFSSAEASQFSLASDGERKRIMERLLGMDVFDRAQKACSEELSAANVALQRAQLAVATAEGAYNVAQATLSALGTFPSYAPAAAEPAAVSEIDLQQARLAYAAAVERAQRASSEYAAARSAPPLTLSYEPEPSAAAALLALSAELRDATRRLELARAGQCSSCGQVWAGEAPAALEQLAGDTEWELNALQQAEDERRAVWNAGVAAARSRHQVAMMEDRAAQQAEAAALQRQTLLQRASSERAAWAEFEAKRQAEWQRQRDAHEIKRTRAHAEALTCADELDDLQHACDLATRQRDTLQAVAGILGVRGLRGHVLGRALDGVEAVANYWLGQIAPGQALTVRAEGDAGKITIGLRGYGGGKYKAASGGERRRIDAPLLLALAEVAGAGRTRGTLFLDEVFDALDHDGRMLVCQALGELGQTQSVVVITHAEDLAQHIPAVQRLQVVAGRIERK